VGYSVRGFTVIKDPPEAEWNKALSLMEEGNYGQTFEYGEVWSTLPHMNVLRLLATDTGDYVGLLQAVYRKRFGVGVYMRVGGIAGGAPLVRGNREQRASILGSLLEALEESAHARRIIQSRIWWEAKWGMNETFLERDYRLAREINIYVVPLLPPENLWKKLHHNKRRKIRQAMEKGVEIVEGQDHQDLLSFYSMHLDACRRANIGHAPLREVEGFWNLLRPKGKAKLFLAKWKGRDVAGAFVLLQGKTASVPCAGSIKEGWEARPNDFLHWKIMQWAHQHRLLHYQMGGINPDPHSSSYGVYRWKIEYGGAMEKMLNYDKVYYPRLTGLIKKGLIPPYRALKRLLPGR